MTRPIFEPSLPRTDAVLGYGSDQLFRRPAPLASSELPRLWTHSYNSTPISVTLHTAASPVAITSYDTSFEDSDGTYLALNGSGEPVIFGNGMYRVDFGFIFGSGGSSTGNAFYVVVDVTFTPAEANTDYRWLFRTTGATGPTFQRARSGTQPYADTDQIGADAVGTKSVLLAVSRVADVGGVPVRVRHCSALNVDGTTNVTDAYIFEISVTRLGDIQSTTGGADYI